MTQNLSIMKTYWKEQECTINASSSNGSGDTQAQDIQQKKSNIQ